MNADKAVSAKRIVALLVLFALAGCSSTPPPPDIHTSRREFFDGRYTIVLHTVGAANVATDFDSMSSGDKVEREWIKITWNVGKGPESTLVLGNGKLSLNGTSHGEVSPGSEIVVDTEGKLTVKAREKLQ